MSDSKAKNLQTITNLPSS